MRTIFLYTQIMMFYVFSSVRDLSRKGDEKVIEDEKYFHLPSCLVFD